MKKKRLKVLLLLVIIVCIAVGCEKETSKLENRSKFNVVLVDKQIEEYIEKAKNNGNNIDKLYKEIVYKPIFGKFDSNFENYYVQRPIISLDRLGNRLEILVKEDVVSIVKDTLEECNNFLPGVDTTVYIFPYEPEDEGGLFKHNSRGVAGFSYLDIRNIVLSINPTYKNWKTYLPHVVAHEYHHIVWGDRNYKGSDRTLLEDLIIEGSADSFANIVYPDMELLTRPPIQKDQEQEIWNKIKLNLDSTDINYKGKVIFGDNKEFPLLAGYTIGYNIVQEFIKNNPEVNIEEWTNMSAIDILEKSSYEEKLKNSN